MVSPGGLCKLGKCSLKSVGCKTTFAKDNLYLDGTSIVGAVKSSDWQYEVCVECTDEQKVSHKLDNVKFRFKLLKCTIETAEVEDHVIWVDQG